MDSQNIPPLLRRCTQDAWSRTLECLPLMLLMHDESYWDDVSGRGLCAHASGWLHLLLLQEKLASRIAVVQGNIIGHCYVVCKGFRLDATAMQFGANGVVVQLDTRSHSPWYYKNPSYYENIHALCNGLNDRGWHHAQVPKYLCSD